MGFQFNHVGGGTKTRRPITLHMKYNAACVQPNCFLITEDYGEQEVTLEELQVSFAVASGSYEPMLLLQGAILTGSFAIAGCILHNQCPSAGTIICWPSTGLSNLLLLPLSELQGACPISVHLSTTCFWLQDYIENENARLEREQQFWAKEIVVKIEYKFCPNLTIIDTPGKQLAACPCIVCSSCWEASLGLLM